MSSIEAQIIKVSNIKKESTLFDETSKSVAEPAKSVVSFKTSKSAKSSPSKTENRYQ